MPCLNARSDVHHPLLQQQRTRTPNANERRFHGAAPRTRALGAITRPLKSAPLCKQRLCTPDRYRGVDRCVQPRNASTQAGAGEVTSASDVGGGGSSSTGTGSSGGGGGGDNEGGGANAGGPGRWEPRRIWTLIYGISILAGGKYAHVKKGSRPSLIASSIIAAALLLATVIMGSSPVAGTRFAMATTAVLAMFMGNRFRRSRKFMPSGMLALTSAASAIWCGGWPKV